MRPSLFKVLFCTALSFLYLTTPSKELFACSPVEGYLKPSNYRLVKETPVILVAEAISGGDVSKHDWKNGPPTVNFKVLKAIKGRFPASELSLEGVNQTMGRTPENDFSLPRRGASAGACNAYDYQLGKKFVLFLSNSNGTWKVSGPPFSRVNEEVDGVDSPWVKAVQQYASIGALNDYEKENAALRALMMKAALPNAGAEYPKGLVADIERHFSTPSEAMSFEDLMGLYRGWVGDGEAAGFVGVCLSEGG